MIRSCKLPAILKQGLILFLSLHSGFVFSEETGNKAPRRYFRPAVYSNAFMTPASPVTLDGAPTGNFKYTHFNAGYLVPLYTESWITDKGNYNGNFHVLSGANYLRAYPSYSEFSANYPLFKFSWNIRFIYNTGRKSIWFASLSPFISQDDQTFGKPELRYAAALVYNRTVSKNFSYRLGAYRSYILGGRIIYFPVVGLRIGPLDGTWFSFQFPKYASFNFQMGPKFRGSIFAKPSGTIFNYSDFAGKSDVVKFRRYELLVGYLIQFRMNSHVQLHMGSGWATNRFISFSDNKGNTGNDLFQNQMNAASSLFITGGITIRFGKSISIANDINMFDVFDLNNTFDIGSSGDASPDAEMQGKERPSQTIQYRDIQDLISEEDIY